MSDYNKLLDALHTIKEECESHNNSCKQCPLRHSDYICGVTGVNTLNNTSLKPRRWMIREVRLLDTVTDTEALDF